jgi:hypothetical protein
VENAFDCTVERGPSNDQRQWTAQHLQAANCQLTATLTSDPALLALTPPQGDHQNGVRDVDVRGPGEKGFLFLSFSVCFFLFFSFFLNGLKKFYH